MPNVGQWPLRLSVCLKHNEFGVGGGSRRKGRNRELAKQAAEVQLFLRSQTLITNHQNFVLAD